MARGLGAGVTASRQWPQAGVPSLGWKHKGPSPQCCSGAVPGVPARAYPTTPPFRYFWTLTTATPFAEHCPPAHPAFWLSGPVSHPCLRPGSQIGLGGTKGCGEQTPPMASHPSLSNSEPPRVEDESGTPRPRCCTLTGAPGVPRGAGRGPRPLGGQHAVTFGAKSLALAWCTDRSVPTLSSWTRTLACGAVRALVFGEAQARGAEAPDSGSACSLCLGRPEAHRGRGGSQPAECFAASLLSLPPPSPVSSCPLPAFYPRPSRATVACRPAASTPLSPGPSLTLGSCRLWEPLPQLGLAVGKAEVMEAPQAAGRPTRGRWSLHCLFSWPSILENRVEGRPPWGDLGRLPGGGAANSTFLLPFVAKRPP